MPGLLGNPPGILTPGFGPNGPGPIDSRKRVTAVGEGSSVPYGATNGYVTPSLVPGFIGPAAGSLQQPIIWYVRTGGSNNNGGTSIALAGDRSGADGVTNATTTFTSASAAFTSADVGKGICINTGANARHHRIASVTNSTTILLDRTSSNAASLAWVIGGAWAGPRVPLADAAVNADSNSPVRPGDTVYVGAGTYRNVIVTGASWTQNFNSLVYVVGDVTGQYTSDAGMVQLTAYLTNDKTAPSGTSLLNLNGKSNISFSSIMFVGGTGVLVTATTAASQNITFTDCSMHTSGTGAPLQLINITTPFLTQINWLFDRCYLMNNVANDGAILLVTCTKGTLADYNVNVTLRNSLITGPGTLRAVTVSSGGAGSNFGNGVFIYNCTFLDTGAIRVTGTANNSAIFLSKIEGCFIYNGTQSASITSDAGTTLTENFNVILAATPRGNVAVGANSSANAYAPLFHFGQERIWGALQRPFGEPMSGSPLLGLGSSFSLAYDLYNRPRPAGGSSALLAAGAFERANTPSQGTSPAPPSGTYEWQGTGPWYQDFLLPVSATSTTMAVYVQRDSAYAAPPGFGFPAMLILANPRIGVTAQTIADTGSSGAWNTLSASSFTPTGAGWVTVRIVSYDGSGASVVEFADFTIT